MAVNEERRGGNGDVWVADGYGSSMVHRFNMAGAHLMSLSGEEGDGRFDTPHAVFVDRRRNTPELYIADRANGRIQVYDLDGNFVRVVGKGLLNRPTWICADDDRLIVAEFLPPRLTFLDPQDRLIGRLGEDLEAPTRPGWPNELDSNGHRRRASDLRHGYFNSPHTVAVDSVGNIYITEWLIGGRTIKLQRIS